jgi:DNA-binding NarL/FixJ family response regulator
VDVAAMSDMVTNLTVMVADSNQMQAQLLVGALRRRPEFQVLSCPMEIDAVLAGSASTKIDVAVLNAEQGAGSHDWSIVRRFHLARPDIAKILLLGSYDRDTVVNAFRTGVKGLFCFSESPFRLLCRCIQSVHRGQVWANAQQLQYLLNALNQVPSLRVVNAKGRNLLTPREEQVVALVADGLTNREVATELGLTEHTVKKYLFRIFDKLGISSRVELVLYAVSNGDHRAAEWMAGQAVGN